jgi:predicted MFS family arabinose efflux permease
VTSIGSRVLAREDLGHTPQYFAFTASLWEAVYELCFRLGPSLLDAAELARTGTQAAIDGASGAASEASQLALRSLGFDHDCDSRSAAWRSLRYPRFARFFVGSIISNWGTWLQNTAQMLLAYQFTHSVLTVGLIISAQFSTPFLFGPGAGIVADRIGARRTLICTQVGSAAIATILAILEYAHLLSETYLFIGAFAAGLMFTFALPAQAALIPALVPDDPAESKAAVVMNSVAYNAGRMVAPACTVLIVMTAGFWCVFALNAATFAIFAGVLRGVEPLAPVPMSKQSRVRDGLRVVRKDRRIIFLLLIVASVTLAEDPILVLGPGLARHAFHLSYDCSGYFLCALGAGCVVSSILPRTSSLSARRTAAALSLLGLSIVTFVWAPWMWLSVAAAGSAGLWGLVAGSAAQTMLRQLAGKEQTLQVMGLWAVAWAGSKPFASLLDGLLPSVISVQSTGLIMAAPALIPSVVFIVIAVARRAPKSSSARVPVELHSPLISTDVTGENIAPELANASALPTSKFF